MSKHAADPMIARWADRVAAGAVIRNLTLDGAHALVAVLTARRVQFSVAVAAKTYEIGPRF